MSLPSWRKTLLLSTTFVLSAFSAQSQSLDTALESLLAHNASVEIARQNLVAAQKNFDATYTLLYPKVVLKASIARTSLSNSTVQGIDDRNDRTKTVQEASVKATQELFSGYSDMARIEGAEANFKRTQAALQSAQQAEMARGAVAYYAVLQELALIESLEHIATLYQNNLDSAKESANTSTQPNAAVVSASKDLVNQRALIVAQKRRLARAKGSFARYFGQNAETDIMQFSLLSDADMPVSLEDFLEQIPRSAAIIAENMKAEMSRAKAKGSLSSAYPSLTLSLEHSRDYDSFTANDDNIDLLFTEETRLELELEWELSALLYNKHAHSSASARTMSNRSRAHALLQRLEGQAINLWDDYQHYLSEIELLENIRQDEQNLEAIETEKIANGKSKSAKAVRLQIHHERTQQRLIRATHGLEQTKANILALTNNLLPRT